MIIDRNWHTSMPDRQLELLRLELIEPVILNGFHRFAEDDAYVKCIDAISVARFLLRTGSPVRSRDVIETILKMEELENFHIRLQPLIPFRASQLCAVTMSDGDSGNIIVNATVPLIGIEFDLGHPAVHPDSGFDGVTSPQERFTIRQFVWGFLASVLFRETQPTRGTKCER